MVKYTMLEFTSSTTTSSNTSTKRRKLSHSIAPPSDKPVPFVAPPSPLFAGINEDINLEPFPDLEDFSYPEAPETEPLHCTLHCQHDICMSMVCRKIEIVQCSCTPKAEQQSEEESSLETAPAPSLTEFEVDDLVLNSLGRIAARADPDREITVRGEDIPALLGPLEYHAEVRAMDDLAPAMETVVSEQRNVAAALEFTEILFEDIRLYFARILRPSGYRVLTPRQLRLELLFYAKTMSLEGVRMPEEAVQFCKECVKDVVGLMVWRNGEVRKC